jgi:hypothetical protein
MKATGLIAAALSASTLALAGCYVVPVVDRQGNMQYEYYPLPPVGAPAPKYPAPYAGAPSHPSSIALNVRLYPNNDIASQTGVVNGTVINMMNGKGRFQLQYGGEVLTGETTRVSGDSHRGVASAYGSSGSYMSCEYQMDTPRQGAGTCTFSNGARYTAQIGG